MLPVLTVWTQRLIFKETYLKDVCLITPEVVCSKRIPDSQVIFCFVLDKVESLFYLFSPPLKNTNVNLHILLGLPNQISKTFCT